MFARIAVILAFCVASTIAAADISIRADILTAAEEPDPPGLIVIDILVDVSDDDTWTATGLRITTANQARLSYAHDPNTAEPVLVNPGVVNRYVTSVSHPAARLGVGRFQNSRAIVAGAYCPSSPAAIASPTELNVAYFAVPSPDLVGRDGAVARIVIEHNYTACFSPGCAIGIFPVDEVPLWATTVIARCETFRCDDRPGMVAGSTAHPEPAGHSWVFAMGPEFPCPYDLNFDCSGQVDVADLASLLTVFGAAVSPSHPADLDRSSRVDIADLAIFLSHFGDDCCGL